MKSIRRATGMFYLVVKVSLVALERRLCTLRMPLRSVMSS